MALLVLSPAHLAPGFTYLAQEFDAGTGNEQPVTAQTLAFVAGGRETGFHPLRDSNVFLLGYGGDNRDRGSRKMPQESKYCSVKM